MPSSETQAFGAVYERILAVYEDLGYPRTLVGRWAMPERDAGLLAAACRKLAPRRVLEVGTYVGVSTMVLALCTPDGTRIHTVDPGLPLRVENEAMECDGCGADLGVTTTELARRAAGRLGVADKIVFHTGGFSQPLTFAGPGLRLGDPVGPAVCREAGPFDFALVDGLHFGDAVESDLRCLQGAMTATGVMALHDLIGCWGSQVREAAARFLEAFPDWRLEHPDYADLYWSLGFLRRTPEAVLEAQMPLRPGLLRPGLLRHFAEALARLFPGAGLAVAGAPPELFPWLATAGFADLVILEDEPDANLPDGLPVLPWAALATSGRRFDVVLCLGALERRPPGDEARLLDALAGAGDTLVFAATPVGERGGDAPNQRPIAWWAARLLERGYVLHDSLRPLLEPWTFPAGARDKRVESSALATLLVARKARLPLTEKDWATVYLENQRRLESLTLQQIALAHFYWNQEWRREAYEGYLRDAQRENARLRERLARLEGRASDGGED